MSFHPDVSVVIPTRNRPELLRRAILSALHQTHTSLEVVVILDGPDDATVATVRSFNDPRLQLVCLDPAVGGSEARNAGARAAKGRWIALLDDDDEWLPNKLALQLEIARPEASPNFVVVTQYLFRREDHADEVWPGHLPGTSEPLSEFLFSSRGGFQTSTYLCPRELLLRVPFTRGLKKHQDWDWFLRLIALPDFQLRVVVQPLSIYWVPLRVRSSVSGYADWRFSLAWAKSNRAFMTRRAYAMFLVRICARGATADHAGPAWILRLLSEVLFIGRPSVHLLADFALSAILPQELRPRLRSLWMRFQSNAKHSRANPGALHLQKESASS